MTPKLARYRGLLTAASAAALLAACGGGSGSSGLEQPQALASAESSRAAAQPSGAAQVAARAYIVQLAEPPVSAYDGGIQGLAATRPGKGKKINPNARAVVDYRAFLSARQDAVLASAGGGKKLHSYGYVFNGFAAEMSDEQAQKLRATRGVLSVSKDELRQVDTASTPAFLGISGDNGFWATTKAKGEGVIIGIIDGGIWPEHPSFSDRTDVNGNGTKDGKLGYQQIPGWNGRCQPGQAFNGSHCNQKLIGARFYNEGYGGNAGVAAALPYEFLSPRDYDGHGTHTASTAGGAARRMRAASTPTRSPRSTRR